MNEHELAAYVDGFNLEEAAPRLREGLAQFVASGCWSNPRALVVDRREPPETAEPGFFPQWDLGLNLGLDHIATTPNWSDGLQALVAALQALHRETGKEFVLFVCFRSNPERQEHVAFVDGRPVKLSSIKGMIERLTLRSRP
jgi:hypothetical protein